ncbi:G-D-S-L family lipolytic protein [Panacibacter ginsenosidivorans]|uniref:G-D-S-L family lipolytic protein n=1 Tax=Panacibacter ginsenosidivorans TaxID=1813871 RepID=A0A5B8VAK1_9BACT|nr:GDSL-type esterase/lipase family protein [Panacibacter ginsenosidivorans]QEC67901.1 G-D-S-L family lipolytic protein [Panacibacter ginsenosidivorans]
MLAKSLASLFIAFLCSATIFAQVSLPFAGEIQKFRQADSTQMPSQNEILFVGSSSFTKWTDVQNYFPAYPIINRGFGGSTLLDVTMYADDVIFPYHPKQIVIYCGENDLAYVDTVSAQTVANRFITLFDVIRHVWNEVPIDFISIKPSPSREKLMPKMIEANKLIKSFLASKKNTAFIDVFSKMLTQDGKLMPGIYIEDKLHMNAKGYAIWQKEIEPYLVK